MGKRTIVLQSISYQTIAELISPDILIERSKLNSAPQNVTDNT